MRGDGLGDRMKNYYENISRIYLCRKIPVIVRLDGKSFHTFTKGCDKPFDSNFIQSMQTTTEYLMRNVQGAKVGYVQSDEISLLLTDYDRLVTHGWFDYNVQKMCSISSGMASVAFTISYAGLMDVFNSMGTKQPKYAFFDARCFNVPKEDVINYFRWRYQDWRRNSLSMQAQSLFSHKELHGKKKSEQYDMCISKGQNWEELSPEKKNGTLFYWSESEADGVSHLEQTSDINLNSNDECEDIFGEFI